MTNAFGLLEFLHITPQYSNAVLVAVLPHFSNFAGKVHLPITTPITTNQVLFFQPSKIKGDVGGHLVLTNRFEFWFAHGCVDGFSSGTNYFQEQNPERIFLYFGKDTLTTNAAIEMARNTLTNAGYATFLPFTSQPPAQIEGPHIAEFNKKNLPHYRISWEADDKHFANVSIDGRTREVVGMFIASTNVWTNSPIVTVPVETEVEYRKRISEEGKIKPNETPPQKLKKDPPRLRNGP